MLTLRELPCEPPVGWRCTRTGRCGPVGERNGLPSFIGDKSEPGIALGVAALHQRPVRRCERAAAS